jgi:hypothetical protein
MQPSAKAKALSTTSRLNSQDKAALEAFKKRDDEIWLESEASEAQIELVQTYKLVDTSFKDRKMAEALQQVIRFVGSSWHSLALATAEVAILISCSTLRSRP